MSARRDQFWMLGYAGIGLASGGDVRELNMPLSEPTLFFFDSQSVQKIWS